MSLLQTTQQKLIIVADGIDKETAVGAPFHWIHLDTASVKLGVRRAYVVLAAAFLSFFFLFVGFGAHFFSHLLGFMYPAYASFKAIKAHDQKETKQWFVGPFSFVQLSWRAQKRPSAPIFNPF